MSVIDLQSFQSLVDRRYREIVEYEYASQIDQIGEMYSIETSDSYEERRGSVGELPTWDEFNGSLNYVRMYEQYNTITTHREFAQALRWTRQMVDDDLTGIMRGDRYRRMVRSGLFTRQQHAARLFNFATSNDTYFYTRSEGVPLASASHTTRTPGVSTASGFSNLSTQALTQVAYRTARITMRRTRNDQGQITNVMANCLFVPIDLEPKAREIIETDRQPESANNAVNPEYNTATIVVLIHWNDTNDWAICNKEMMHENCIWFNRVNPEYQQIVDFETKQLKSSGYGRWGSMVMDWRWLHFSSVS